MGDADSKGLGAADEEIDLSAFRHSRTEHTIKAGMDWKSTKTIGEYLMRYLDSEFR